MELQKLSIFQDSIYDYKSKCYILKRDNIFKQEKIFL